MAEYNIPDECFYSREDEWVRIEGEEALIGITDYAQQQLGDVVFVELPEVNSDLSVGQAFGVIESVKAVSDLFAPITGVVSGVNGELEDRPEAVNESCYEDGWMIKVTGYQNEEFDTLMNCQEYQAYCDERKD